MLCRLRTRLDTRLVNNTTSASACERVARGSGFEADVRQAADAIRADPARAARKQLAYKLSVAVAAAVAAVGNYPIRALKIGYYKQPSVTAAIGGEAEPGPRGYGHAYRRDAVACLVFPASATLQTPSGGVTWRVHYTGIHTYTYKYENRVRVKIRTLACAWYERRHRCTRVVSCSFVRDASYAGVRSYAYGTTRIRVCTGSHDCATIRVLHSGPLPSCRVRDARQLVRGRPGRVPRTVGYATHKAIVHS